MENSSTSLETWPSRDCRGDSSLAHSARVNYFSNRIHAWTPSKRGEQRRGRRQGSQLARHRREHFSVQFVGSGGRSRCDSFSRHGDYCQERKREIGILKAIGFSNRRIVAQYSSTAVTFTVFGWLIGLIIGLIGVGPITSSLVSNSGVSTDTGARGLFGASNPLLAHLSDVNAQVGWAAIFEVLAVAIVIAIVASAFSAWLISKVRPAEVLRSE